MIDQFGFNNKSVLVTGSTAGLGRAFAESFHRLGATVAINGRTAASVERAIREMGGGARLVAAPGDLSVTAERKRVTRGVLERLGGLDVLVNNAGRDEDCLFEEVTEQYWQQMLDLNLKAAFFTCQDCVAALKERRGNIVNVASSFGLIGGPPGCSVASTTKGALIQMTRMMALALAGTGIRVNALCPGWIDTPATRNANALASNNRLLGDIARTTPVGRIGTPAECVGTVLFLASSANSYTTGAIVSADGGLSSGH